MLNGRESKLREEEQRRELALLRLNHAKEQISYISGILELGDYKTVANRSYYSVFYAMRAVLALDGYDSKKHSGIISEFRKRYIKTGVFPETLSDIIGELFSVRSASDYDDFYVISKEKARLQYDNATVFVDTITQFFINNSLL